MKNVIFIIIIIIRILDLSLTFLLEGNSLETETSPIISVFNGNWMAMIISNVILIVGLALIIFKFDNLSYLSEKENRFDKRNRFVNYLNYLYFNSYAVKNYMTAHLDLRLFCVIFLHLLPYIIITQGIFAITNSLIAMWGTASFIQGIPRNLVIHLFVVASATILIMYNVLFLLKRFKELND